MAQKTVLTLFALLSVLFFTSCDYPEWPASDEPFRVALSLSPFSLNQFEDGYSFKVGEETAATPEELQSIYKNLGSTEMYVRIATKRHVTRNDDGTLDNIVDGKEDENSNVHTFDQAIELCKIAAELDMPINPEIMCAHIYMDMDRQEAPNFDEYPEFNELMNGKKWSELSLDEVKAVLKAYGKFVAGEFIDAGCTVNNWNIGNEANNGFAGIGIGMKTAVNPELEDASDLMKFTGSLFSVYWLKEHLWNYEAKAMAAVKEGVLEAYAEKGLDASGLKFSTHIATVVATTRSIVSFFKTLKENGFAVDVAGISFYPSATSISIDKWDLLKRTVVRINHELEVPVFIAEFSYPSGKMSGPFKSWNKKFDKYSHSQSGQADLYGDLVSWGKKNGIAGVRYWAPDYEKWYGMAMFEFEGKVGTAKTILLNHKELIGK
ncbi:glycosyl hydrolase 53 family protein [bacterium]|nr:glycosyl hydrolase 53 family protein [bacterium]